MVTFEAVAQVTDGLHFYFPFDEGKGDTAHDMGPKGFETKLTGDAKFTNSGKIGGALDVKQGSATIANPEQGQDELYVEFLSVVAWIFPREISNEALGTGHVYGNIFYDKSGPDSDDNVEFGLGSSKGIYFYVNTGEEGMGPFNGADIDTTLPLKNYGFETDTWYHVAGTFDGEKIRVYINGILEGEKDVPESVLIWNDNDIHIGGRPDTSNWYNGLVDEIAVYDRALTEKEVKVTMESILAVEPVDNISITWGNIKKK